MGLKDIFLGFFDDDGTLDINEFDLVLGKLAVETFYKELAVQACTNLIANAVSRAEFLTFENGEQTKKDNYYLFNVEPNRNQSASKFWRKAVSELVRENEVLIIQDKGNNSFYVADSFTTKKDGLSERKYTNISVGGSSISQTYRERNVLHLELHNKKMKKVITSLNKSYGKLISVSQSNYKRNNSRKVTVDIDASMAKTDEAQKDLKDLMENKLGEFLNSEGPAALPLTQGEEIEELESDIGTQGGANNDEIRSFVDDIFDFVAMGFQVPPVIIKGQVADSEQALQNFLTFCINPIAELLSDEINRKLYGKKAYLNNTYMKVDTSNIKAVDITEVANSLDVLTRIGGYSIDDTLKKLGKEPIGGEIGQARFMTKNYQEINKRSEERRVGKECRSRWSPYH